MNAWDGWEDYRAGLYEPTINPAHVDQSARLLKDPDAFYEAAVEMLREWPKAAHHNLSNMWSGRNAWLGQATCCYPHEATGASTRDAWGQMTNIEQTQANAVAAAVRLRWAKGQDNAQTLFAD